MSDLYCKLNSGLVCLYFLVFYIYSLLDEAVLDALFRRQLRPCSPACLTSILLQKEVSEDDHPENDEEYDDKAEAQLALVIVDSLHPVNSRLTH